MGHDLLQNSSPLFLKTSLRMTHVDIWRQGEGTHLFFKRKWEWRWVALSTVGRPHRARGTAVTPWVCLWPSHTSWQLEYQHLSFVFLQKKPINLKNFLNSQMILSSGQGSSSLSSTTKLIKQEYQGSHHPSRESKEGTRFISIGWRQEIRGHHDIPSLHCGTQQGRTLLGSKMIPRWLTSFYF